MSQTALFLAPQGFFTPTQNTCQSRASSLSATSSLSSACQLSGLKPSATSSARRLSPAHGIVCQDLGESITDGVQKAAAEVANAAGAAAGAAATAVTERFDAKAFRRQLNKSENYNRSGFGHKKEMLEKMNQEYTSDVIKQLRDNNFTYTWGDVTVHLAESYGFCWGVERAVQMAYEARKQFPDQKIWITNEIIHNPTVNKKLSDMGVEFVPVHGAQKEFGLISERDVVVLPAFGASVQEMKVLNDKKVQIVDTTCPWVSKVWDSVEKYRKNDHTAVIHGKYAHEETVATASFAATYIIVKNVEEATYVCDYILGGELDGSSRTREEFLEKFSNAISQGFDPDTDLKKVGIANQTTMLKGETEEIGKLLEKTMMRAHGVTAVSSHFMSMNTICDATQERQDAMYSLVDKPLALMMVVGGFNSSNTSHLQEIAEHRSLPSYWVDTVERVGPGNRCQHKLLYGELVDSEGFLPQGPIQIGVTSGASTPDKVVEDVLNAIFFIKREMAMQPVAA